MKDLENYRDFLKAHWWDERDRLETDRVKRLPQPPLQKPYASTDKMIDLIDPDEFETFNRNVFEAIKYRKTHRRFLEEHLSLHELSFLLWATQGVHKIDRTGTTKRTVPSAGSRHPFETYILIDRVNGISPGIYRYLSLEHKMCPIFEGKIYKDEITDAFKGQSFIAESAAIFIWTVIPYRSEWQYLMVAPKMIALDAGHVCQNLYIACEAIKAGTCAIGKYDQKLMDNLVHVDGEEEFVIYAAAVGKVNYK
jgi:SagB-type dehydrogenase family enzyme